jgi:fatty acid desaturase
MIHIPQSHLPIGFLVSCMLSGFLALGILNWGFPPSLLVIVPWIVGALYLLILTVLQWPELREMRRAAEAERTRRTFRG